MLAVLGLLTSLTSGAAFGAEPVRDVMYRAAFGGTLPTFDKGYLVEYASRSSILMYGPDGQFRYEAQITSPNGAGASVMNAAVDSDGTAAVSYGTPDVGGIIILDPSGKLLRRIETGPFRAAQLTFSPAHAIWALGGQLDTDDPGREARQYRVLRRYSREGQETGQFLPRSQFAGWASPGTEQRGHWCLRAADDRLGALLYPFHGGYEPEWMEVDFEGRLIGRWKLGAEFRSQLAFTAGGALYTTTRTKDGQLTLSRFDKQTSSWTEVPVVLPPPELYGPLGPMLGADGNAVVIPATPRQRLLWFKVD